jgi:hypothetical protein
MTSRELNPFRLPFIGWIALPLSASTEDRYLVQTIGQALRMLTQRFRFQPDSAAAGQWQRCGQVQQL